MTTLAQKLNKSRSYQSVIVQLSYTVSLSKHIPRVEVSLEVEIGKPGITKTAQPPHDSICTPPKHWGRQFSRSLLV